MKKLLFAAFALLMVSTYSTSYAQQGRYVSMNEAQYGGGYQQQQYGRSQSFGTTMGKAILTGALRGIVNGLDVAVYKMERNLYRGSYQMYGYGSYNNGMYSNYCYLSNGSLYPLYYSNGNYYEQQQVINAQIQAANTDRSIRVGMGGW